MRISPVSYLNARGISTNNRKDYSPKSALIHDTVSFGAKPMSAKSFKKLSRQMVCLYTGEPMLTDSMLKKNEIR